MKNSKSGKSSKVNSSRRSISYQDLSNSPDQMTFNNQQPQFPNQFQQMQQFTNTNQQFTNTNQQFTNTNQFQQFPSQPFSQYSSYQSQPSQFPNMFQYPTQPLAYTPEDNDDADEVEVAPKGRVQMFTQPEDVLLAKAYVRVSENPMFGADQKFAIFWEKITNEYNESAVQEELGERAKKSLMNRFHRMKSEMVTYNEAVNFVESTHHTGINETGRLKLVNDKFKLLNTKLKNRGFCFDHVVEILNKCSKFNFTTTRNKMPMYQEDHHSSSSSPGEHDGSGHASTGMQRSVSGGKRSRTDSEDVSSPPRPMGTKQAKRADKLGKGKAKKLSYDEGEERMNYIENLTAQRQESFTLKQELLSHKNKALQENFELQARKLAYQEKKLAMEAQQKEWERDQRRLAMELEKEQRIMSMDPDQILDDEQRNRLLQMKINIMEKWSSQGGF